MPARRLALTPELVARVERIEADPGPEAGLTELADADYAAAAHDLLARHPGGPVWLFAYGSLIWKPDFEHDAETPATAHGWRRAFTLEMFRWRGSPDQPGLMMALERGGTCRGMAFRLPPDDPHGRLVRLLRRETSYHPDLGAVRWIVLRDGDRRFPALAFWADCRVPGYTVRLPIEDQARRLARAAGHIGSGAAYLHNTIVHLEERGIHDRYLWRLQALVAQEIAALPEPLAPPARGPEPGNAAG
jgi:cation transport protein ChaC